METLLSTLNNTAFVTCEVDVPRARLAGLEMIGVGINMESTLDDPAFEVLADDERERAARFIRKADALRSAATRAALRNELGKRIGVVPSTLRFMRDAAGRPYLAERTRDRCHDAFDFSVSHAGDYALIALAEGRRVGVDIEAYHHNIDWKRLSACILSFNEQAYVASLPEASHMRTFYEAWTGKEALLKALGVGISAGMRRFSVIGGRDGEPVDGMNTDIKAFLAQRGSPASDFDASWCPVPIGYAACVVWSGAADSIAVVADADI